MPNILTIHNQHVPLLLTLLELQVFLVIDVQDAGSLADESLSLLDASSGTLDADSLSSVEDEEEEGENTEQVTE